MLKTILKNKLIIIYFIIVLLINFNLYYFLNQALKNEIKFQNYANVISTIKEYKDLTKQIHYESIDFLKPLVLYKRSLNTQGDMFVFDPKTKKIIFDASSDCKLPESRSYLKKGSICSLFYDPNSCVKAAEIMSKEKHGYFTWNFYKDPEIVYFHRIKINNKDYVIANGSRIKDIFYFNILKALIAIYLFINIIFLIFIFRIKTIE